MFDRIQNFFNTLTASTPSGVDPNDPLVAVAALCIQVMEADGTVSDNEKERLRTLLRQHYGRDGAELDALIDAGREAGNEAVDYYRFTADVKRHLNEDQRVELIGILWDIVYADGIRNELEDHVLWRIADLLGVSGTDRIALRQRAEAHAPEPAQRDD